MRTASQIKPEYFFPAKSLRAIDKEWYTKPEVAKWFRRSENQIDNYRRCLLNGEPLLRPGIVAGNKTKKLFHIDDMRRCKKLLESLSGPLPSPMETKKAEGNPQPQKVSTESS